MVVVLESGAHWWGPPEGGCHGEAPKAFGILCLIVTDFWQNNETLRCNDKLVRQTASTHGLITKAILFFRPFSRFSFSDKCYTHIRFT